MHNVSFLVERRMGENLLATSQGSRPLLRYRENTIHSLNAAANAGASFVEFDVQVKVLTGGMSLQLLWHKEIAIHHHVTSGNLCLLWHGMSGCDLLCAGHS
jgi:hypothetical protein